MGGDDGSPSRGLVLRTRDTSSDRQWGGWGGEAANLRGGAIDWSSSL